MSGGRVERVPSLTSSSSSDSDCLDPSSTYARIDIDPEQDLLPTKVKGEKSSSHHSRLTVVSLALSVFCLISLVASLVVFYVVYKTNGLHGGSPERERVCMPCSQISPDPLAEADSPILRELDTEVDEDGESFCCASTPAQYATLFKLILKRQEEVKKLADIMGSGDNANKDTSKGSLGAKAVSAHLLAKPTQAHDDDHGHIIQQWKSPEESPVSHVLAGLKFHDNKLYVQDPGLYFIYCQILFNRPHADSAQEKSYELASHYVKRFSVLYPSSTGLLLKARHTRAMGEDDRHSSFVGGLFFLHAGDQLFVHVSVPELVAFDDKASFFGMFKVGN